MKYNLRIPHADIDKAEYNLDYRTNHIPKLMEMMRSEPDKVPQRRLFSIVNDYAHLGFFKYALGFNIAVCRELFASALRTNIEAFRLCGTQEAFPVMDLFIDPSKPKDDPGRSRLQLRHEPGTKDFSSTNSKDAYKFTCLGFGIGEDELAREQASMIWDPPDADYIGLRSEVCTPNQQALAYALRLYVKGNGDGAMANLSRVRTLPGDYVGSQAQLLKAIIQRDAENFQRNLQLLLAKHQKISKRESWNSIFYICVPALGLAAVAVKMGLITNDQLPQNVYLPIEFFRGRPGQ